MIEEIINYKYRLPNFAYKKCRKCGMTKEYCRFPRTDYNKNNPDKPICSSCKPQPRYINYPERPVSSIKEMQLQPKRKPRELILKSKTDTSIPAQEKRTWIYFIKSREYIKIGVTNNLKSRMESINTSNPVRCDLIYSIESKSKAAYRNEKRLHKIYDRYRVNGEWFAVPSKIIEHIRVKGLLKETKTKGQR